MASHRERRAVADAMDCDYRDRTRMFSVRHTNKDLGGEIGVIVLRGCACVFTFSDSLRITNRMRTGMNASPGCV